MSRENLTPIIQSFSMLNAWNNGRAVKDPLTPSHFYRKPTLFQKAWRTEKASSNLDWGSENFSYLLPESLTVLSSAFLRIELPAVGNGAFYRKNPGMYAVERVRVLSSGNVVYEADPRTFLRDYLESLSNEEYKTFCKTYLGRENSLTGDARTVWCPIPLPNSHYLMRQAKGHSQGVLPCSFQNSRLEISITMAPATALTNDGSQVGSINSACFWEMNEVKMTPSLVNSYAKLTGDYNLISRRFNDVTDWQHAAADQPVTEVFQKLLGSITELIILAVPAASDVDNRALDQENCIQPKNIQFNVDSIVVRDFPTSDKCRIHLYQNGFVENDHVPTAARLCFGSHVAETHCFSGAFNMANSSNINLKFEFAQECKFKIISVQYQHVTISNQGALRAFIE